MIRSVAQKDKATGAKYPRREFEYIEAAFSLDAERAPKRSGYRPLWRLDRQGAEPLLVGMNEMTLLDQDLLQPGSTGRTKWVFVPDVQGYIEDRLSPGAVFEVCDGGQRVGIVRVIQVVYRPSTC